MPPKKRAKPGMSAEHKEALAIGREQGRAVRRYLEALEAHRPKRGRKRTAESVKKQLADVEQEIKRATGIARLTALQKRRDLEVELAGMQGGGSDVSALEKEFVKVAKDYSARKGISYGAWREFGVAPDVLKKAGITSSVRVIT